MKQKRMPANPVAMFSQPVDSIPNWKNCRMVYAAVVTSPKKQTNTIRRRWISSVDKIKVPSSLTTLVLGDMALSVTKKRFTVCALYSDVFIGLRR